MVALNKTMLSTVAISHGSRVPLHCAFTLCRLSQADQLHQEITMFSFTLRVEFDLRELVNLLKAVAVVLVLLNA